MSIKSQIEMAFNTFIRQLRDVICNEHGYYYVNYEQDNKGNKKIIIGDTPLIVLVLCITMLLLTILTLSFKAGILSQAIAVVMLLGMSALLVLALVVGKLKTVPLNVNILIILIIISCLVILGLSAKDIVELINVLGRKL